MLCFSTHARMKLIDFFLLSLGFHIFSCCLTFPSGFNTAATSHRPTYASSSTLHVHRHNITSMAFQDSWLGSGHRNLA